MRHSKINIVPIVLFSLFPIEIMGQEVNIGSAVAENRIINFYRDLSNYAKDANTHRGSVYRYTDTREKLVKYFDGPDGLVNSDINQIVNGDRTEEVKINSYLDNLDKIASSRVINFEPYGFDGFIDDEKDDNEVRFFVCSLLELLK